jgi:hypothetical protein
VFATRTGGPLHHDAFLEGHKTAVDVQLEFLHRHLDAMPAEAVIEFSAQSELD